MAFATNGDVRLYWRQDGSDARPALLLLHPILADHGVWDRMIPLLADHFRILRMDLRGHGASSATGADAALADLAADAWAVLHAVEVDRVLVCGLGLGAWIGLQMAADRPGSVAGLAVAASARWESRIAAARESGIGGIVSEALDSGIDERGKAISSVWRDPLRRVMLGTSVAGYCECAAAIRDVDLGAVARRVSAPTLVLRDGNEEDRLAGLVPAATEAFLTGGDFACLHSPGALAASIARFFEGLWPDGLARDHARNGERVRREVLGDAWVDRSIAGRNGWIADYQDYATEVAWHTVWGRKGLDYRTRRLLVLAITASLGRWEEFRLHVRSGIERGSLTVQDVKEVSLQTGLYAGVPVANTAFAECAALFRDMGIPIEPV